mgnify:CR=1 FL=1
MFLSVVVRLLFPVGNFHQAQHHGDLCQHAYGGGQGGGAGDSEQGNGHGYGQFEEVGSTDHAGRSCNGMRQLEQVAGAIGDGKDQIGLEYQGNGNQQDMEGIGQDDLGLGTENDHQGQQQSPGGCLIEFMDKDLVEIRSAFSLYDADSGQDPSGQGNHYEQEDAQEQHAVGNSYMGYTQQVFDNGYKCHQDDQIIGGYLNHRISGVPPGQGAPYKDHGRTGSCTQENGPGHILGCQFLWNESVESMIKEEGSQTIHGK